jgi:hypothetical protein
VPNISEGEHYPGPRALAAMSATIVLDNRPTHYTNLDFLSGRVILHLPTEAAIGGIQVKLEGESHTRLSGPRNPQHVHSEKKRTELEVHKVRDKAEGLIQTCADPYRYFTKLQLSFPRRLSCSPVPPHPPIPSLLAHMNIPSSSRSTPPYTVLQKYPPNTRLVPI